MDTGAKVDGHDGHYELDITEPNTYVVYNVNATTPVTLQKATYDFPLDPTDGLPSYPASNSFKGDVTKGVVRNFVLKVTGVKPDDRDYNPPQLDYEGKWHGAFYGGDVDVQLANWAPADEQLELDFTPTAPLIDGSQGKPITLTAEIPKGRAGVDVHDIPLGEYSLSAKVNGAPAQVSMKIYGTPVGYETPSASVPIIWVPDSTTHLSYPTVTVH